MKSANIGKAFAVIALSLSLVACGGGGGSSAPSTVAAPSNPTPPVVVVPPTPVKPIEVLKSSYENKVAAGIAIGGQVMPQEVSVGNAVAFGDFFQDGTYSMVTHTLEYIPEWSTTKFGHIKFYQRDKSGLWIDKTSTLLKENVGCLHPRKAVVADFNGDKKPDVFFACHGFDRAPFVGEQPRVLFSQADGTYKNVALPVTGFFHSASAVDFSGNGFADIVVTDNLVRSKPFFLVNNKDGTFKVDETRLPASLDYKSIFSVELIDFNASGKYDMWIGGNEPGASAKTTVYDIAPTIIPNDGNNNFATTKMIELPTTPEYGLPLDIVFSDGKIYMLRTNIDGGHTAYGTSYYTKTSVQVVDYKTLQSSTVYTHADSYPNGQKWVNWIIPFNNTIVSMDSAYGVMITK